MVSGRQSHRPRGLHARITERRASHDGVSNSPRVRTCAPAPHHIPHPRPDFSKPTTDKEASLTIDPGNEGVDSSHAAVTAHLDQLAADVARIRREHGELTDRLVAVWAMQLIQGNGAELLRTVIDLRMCEHQVAALAHEVDRYGQMAEQIARRL